MSAPTGEASPVDHAEQANLLLDRAREEAANGVLGIAAVTVARAQVHATLAHTAAVEQQTLLAHGISSGWPA